MALIPLEEYDARQPRRLTPIEEFDSRSPGQAGTAAEPKQSFSNRVAESLGTSLGYSPIGLGAKVATRDDYFGDLVRSGTERLLMAPADTLVGAADLAGRSYKVAGGLIDRMLGTDLESRVSPLKDQEWFQDTYGRGRKQIADFVSESLTPETQAQQQAVSKAIEEADGNWLDKIGAGAMAAVDNPRALGVVLAQSAGDMALGLGAARVMANAALARGVAPAVAGSRAGTTAIAAEATQAANYSVDQAGQYIDGLTDEQLSQQSPEFAERAREVGAKQARAEMRSDAMTIAGAISGVATAAGGKLTGAGELLGDLATRGTAAARKATGTGLGAAAKGFGTGVLKEGGEEFIQEGGDAYAQNEAAISSGIDPNRSRGQGVLAQAGMGAVAGAVMGGPMGALSREQSSEIDRVAKSSTDPVSNAAWSDVDAFLDRQLQQFQVDNEILFQTATGENLGNREEARARFNAASQAEKEAWAFRGDVNDPTNPITGEPVGPAKAKDVGPKARAEERLAWAEKALQGGYTPQQTVMAASIAAQAGKPEVARRLAEKARAEADGARARFDSLYERVNKAEAAGFPSKSGQKLVDAFGRRMDALEAHAAELERVSAPPSQPGAVSELPPGYFQAGRLDEALSALDIRDAKLPGTGAISDADLAGAGIDTAALGGLAPLEEPPKGALVRAPRPQPAGRGSVESAGPARPMPFVAEALPAPPVRPIRTGRGVVEGTGVRPMPFSGEALPPPPQEEPPQSGAFRTQRVVRPEPAAIPMGGAPSVDFEQVRRSEAADEAAARRDAARAAPPPDLNVRELDGGRLLIVGKKEDLSGYGGIYNERLGGVIVPAKNVAAARTRLENRSAPFSKAVSQRKDGMVPFPKEAQSLGIPRSKMPQVKAEHRGALTQFLMGRGVTHETEAEVDPKTLSPAQREFSPAKVAAAREFVGGDRAVLVSSDNKILDGTHQALAALEQGRPIRIIRFNKSAADLLPIIREFPSSTLEGASSGATNPAGPGGDRKEAGDRTGPGPDNPTAGGAPAVLPEGPDAVGESAPAPAAEVPAAPSGDGGPAVPAASESSEALTPAPKAKPKKKAKKPSAPTSAADLASQHRRALLSTLIAQGGIELQEKPDITGEGLGGRKSLAGGNVLKLFRKGGMAIDDVRQTMIDLGYFEPGDSGDVSGDAEEVRRIVRAAVDGNDTADVVPMSGRDEYEEMLQAESIADQMAAEEFGLAAIEAERAKIQAEAEETLSEDEIMEVAERYTDDEQYFDKLQEAINAKREQAADSESGEEGRGSQEANPQSNASQEDEGQAPALELEREQDGIERSAGPAQLRPDERPENFRLSSPQKSQAVLDDEAKRDVTMRQRGLLKLPSRVPTTDKARLLRAQGFLRSENNLDVTLEPTKLGVGKKDLYLRAVAAAAKSIFNRNVIYYDGDGEVVPEGFALRDDPNTIYLNAKTDRAVREIIGHELLHTLRTENESLYVETVTRLHEVAKNYPKYRIQLRALYAESGATALDRDTVNEEFTADTLGALFTEPGFAFDLANAMGAKGWARLRNALLAILDRMSARLTKQQRLQAKASPAAQHLRDYITEIDAAKKAILEAAENATARTASSPSARKAGATLKLPASGQPSPTSAPRSKIKRHKTTPNAFDTASTVAKHMEIAQRTFLDSFNRLKRAEEYLKGKGFTFESTYEAEQRMHGRAQKRAEDFKEAYVDPIVDALKKGNLTLEDADKYLYALHVPERNAAIEAKRPGFKSGSGHTDKWAADTIASFTSAQRVLLNGVSNKVQRLNRKKLDTLLDGGLITPEEHQALTTSYKFYVPLKTLQNDDASGPMGRGLDSRGREYREAFGRGDPASSPLTAAIMDANRAIVRAEINQVGQNLLGTVRATPLPELWREVTAADFTTPAGTNVYDVTDPSGNVIETFSNERDAKFAIQGLTGYDYKERRTVANEIDRGFRNDDRIFVVKEGGKEKYIWLQDPRLAMQLKKLGDSGLTSSPNEYVQTAARVWVGMTRFISSVLTRYNLAFAIPNVVRDVTTAVLNAQNQEGYEGGKLGKDIAANVLPAMTMILGEQFGSKAAKNSKLGQLYDQFKLDGGQTGGYGLKDFEDSEKDLAAAIRTLTTSRKATDYARKAADAGAVVLKQFDKVNTAFEDATRLATYISALNQGKTRKEAALLAKNLTVNFNKRGEASPLLNGLYVFFNAAVQGNAAFARAIGKSPKMWAIVGAIALAGFAQAMDDEDDEIDPETGLPMSEYASESERDRNFIINRADGTRIKIPLAYGWNIPWVMGRNMAKVMRGKKHPVEFVADTVESLFENFVPVKKEAPFPSLVQPFISAAKNESPLTQKQIFKLDPYDRNKPLSEQYWDSVNPAYVKLAKMLNTATGGSEFEKGWLDINPGKTEFLMKSYLGGPLQAMTAAMSLFQEKPEGEARDLNRMFVVSRFLGGRPAEFTEQKYRDIERDMDTLKEMEKRGEELSGPEYSKLRDFKRHADRINKTKTKLRRAERRGQVADYLEERLKEQQAEAVRNYVEKERLE